MDELEPEPSDSSLVEDLLHDSSAALATLFDRHADAVYNYAFRRTASWDSAEDATSAVFLEAWRGRTRVLSHKGSALPWLYGIANNVCRNALRSQRRWSNALMRADGRTERVDLQWGDHDCAHINFGC